MRTTGRERRFLSLFSQRSHNGVLLGGLGRCIPSRQKYHAWRRVAVRPVGCAMARFPWGSNLATFATIQSSNLQNQPCRRHVFPEYWYLAAPARSGAIISRGGRNGVVRAAGQVNSGTWHRAGLLPTRLCLLVAKSAQASVNAFCPGLPCGNVFCSCYTRKLSRSSNWGDAKNWSRQRNRFWWPPGRN